MTSTAQVEANRANAQKSTGPRTAEGKAVAAQNAVRHGLLAKEVVVRGEDPGEFELYRQQMLEELAPAGLMEETLAQRIVGLSWRLRRAERLQAMAYDKIETKSERPDPTMSPEDAGKLLAFLVKENMRCPAPASPPPGRRAVLDFNQERVLDRLLVYERRIEHSLYRTMAELRKERLLRQAAGGLPRSTGILPVSNMGVGSQTRCTAFGVPVPPMTVEDIHGQDARATHGRDGDPKRDESRLGTHAHATEPEGGTPNGDGDEACETNPISGGVSSLKCEVASEPSRVAEAPGLPTSNGQPPTGDESACGVGASLPQAQKQSCETNPISAPGSAVGNPVSKPYKTPRMTNADGKWAYDSCLRRWVPLCAALTEEDLNRADARRSE